MSNSCTDDHHTACIIRVLVYIEDHLYESLSLDEMAKIACISPYYFHRLFHAYIGETLSNYVKRLRLQRASERLQHSDASITEIALNSGYETPAGFTKVFNQVMGESPKEYRKKMQPLVQALYKRKALKQGDRTMLKPEYVTRKDEEVLFVRRIGDYKETPQIAFEDLLHYIKTHHIKNIKTFYAMALDDPHTCDQAKCRFDACVALNGQIKPHGEFGIKTIPEGRYAVFTHIGSYDLLDQTFDKIFLEWYPTSKEVLPDAPSFCEMINAADLSVPENKKTTLIFIPLKNR